MSPVIGLSEVKRTGEGYTVLNNGYVLYYKGLPEKREYDVGFLIQNGIAGNVDEFQSINEMVACSIIKLNKQYKRKIFQGYARTTCYDDEQVEQFYEVIKLAVK